MTTQIDYYDKLDTCHPYPAKYPLELADKYIQKYTEENDLVYDPFSGSGTTLLAASRINRMSCGTDINGVAVLLSKFKLIDYGWEEQSILLRFINKLDSEGIDKDFSQLENYDGINHWFCLDAIRALSYIKYKINNDFSDNENLKIFAQVAFSSIVNIVSNQESDTRYAAVKKENVTCDYVLKTFSKKFRQLLTLVRGIERDPAVLTKSVAYYCDAKNASDVIQPNSVDFIITSPPYPNTYDYYLYHKHRMLWLGYDFRHSKDTEIGSRNEFSSKKQPVSNFTNDLREIFAESDKLLKHGAYVVIVIGDGVVSGKLYNSKEHTISICSDIGWELIDSSDTPLEKTSKCFNKEFRANGKIEHTLVFLKK